MLRNNRAWRAARTRPGAMALGVLALGGALALAGITGAEATPDQASASQARGAGPTEPIAGLRSHGWRVELTARRVGEQRATVRIAAFERVDGNWNRVGRRLPVGRRGEWLWKVVTRTYGVYKLDVRMPGGMFPLQAGVRLLRSPSIGPSATYRFAVDHGKLVPVDV